MTAGVVLQGTVFLELKIEITIHYNIFNIKSKQLFRPQETEVYR